MTEPKVTWDNLEEILQEKSIEGILDGEESQTHIISTEEEFQELLKALHEEDE